MKTAYAILLALLFLSCDDIPSGPPAPSSIIITTIHWANQGVPDIKVLVVQTGDSVLTGPNGLAVFTVPAGHYTIRAFGINRGGPVALKTDYDVEAKPGAVAIVDIIDCLPCL